MLDFFCIYQVRLLAEPVKSARKIRQEARQKAQAEKLEKKLGLTSLTPGKVKSETPNKGNKSQSLVMLFMCFNMKCVVKCIIVVRLLRQCLRFLYPKQTLRATTAHRDYHPDLPALEGSHKTGLNPALTARAPAATPLWVRGR